MKKLLLFLGMLPAFYLSNGQMQDSDIRNFRALLNSNQAALGIAPADLQQAIVSSGYQMADEGITMLYLQQSYLDIPLHNQFKVLAFRDKKLISASGEFLAEPGSRINGSTKPGITSTEAVISAIRNRKLSVPYAFDVPAFRNGKFNFGTAGIALHDIYVQLVWQPTDSKTLQLCWEVELAPANSADHWMIRVDASSGKVVDLNNLTVYEQHCSEQVVATTDEAAFTSSWHSASSPTVVNTAAYRVVPYPAESPIHPGGTPAVVNSPWASASGNATSLKWHSDGTTYFDSTRGNNVWAQEDRDNSNSTFGRAAVSTTAQPGLTFNPTPDFAQAPTTTANQQFAVTNLFYWNNIIHDISYLYGFDEPSGNFQLNNQGRGGAGNDYVIADAQDAGGTNNANFSTPVDGTRPRMQMYLFNSVTPNRDGDLDNGIVIHEYAHGISNRLTGGPANSSCLGNAEQGGEGWSDYFALMLTTNWSTAQINDGAAARPMGTYALGQPITGAGIRRYPYSTNIAINPWTYASLAGTGGEVHDIGEIWCMALWEMTWEIIQQDGINPDLYNPTGLGGNSAALKLVMEGMRLQPCSPGFIDARNAILRADTIHFGAKYSCSIWKAFAKRGMGKFASQGSSNSTTDQVASFVPNGGTTLTVTQNVSSQQEGLDIVYTNHLSAGACGALNNFLLTDTLPSNVNYVSGGNYNASTRVVSFPVNLTEGSSQDYSFTVRVNNGAYFPATVFLNEQLTGTAGTIPASWTATSTTSSVWTTHNTRSKSAPNSFFTPNRTSASDQKIQNTNNIQLGAEAASLSFWHWYNSEEGWDGAVVEVSTNGGGTWTDLGPKMTSNGYNGVLSSSPNPLTGRAAFTGNSGQFINTLIDMAAYANQAIKLRFRFGSDGSVAATGWNVDDLLLESRAKVNIRSNLFNSNNVRLLLSDTSTIILPTTCTPAAIILQPGGATVCGGSNVQFSITATGSGITYQWQRSTDGGANFTNVAGETNSTFSLDNVSVSSNGQYRCLVSGTCTTSFASSAAALIVVQPAPPTAFDASRCGSGTATVSASAGAGETIDWYGSAIGGLPLQSGSSSYTTAILTTSTPLYATARNVSLGCTSISRAVVMVNINAVPVNVVGGSTIICGPGSVVLSAIPGTGESVDWFTGSTGGTAVSTGSTFITPTLTNTSSYFAQARNTSTGCISSSRSEFRIQVNAPTASTTNVSICETALPFTWNNTQFTTGGIYTVILTNVAGCDSAARLLLDVAAAIQLQMINGGGTYPVGGNGLPVGLNGSQTGVMYQLLLNGNPVGNPLPGTGAEIGFGNQTAAGNYTVLATTPLCLQLMPGSAVISINTNAPQQFAVTGGGTYCAGGSGTIVGLAASESGVRYQLLRAGGTIMVGTPVSGTGFALSFGFQLAAGDYSVRATNTVSLLSSEMLNNVFVRVAALRTPSAPGTVTGPADVCALLGTNVRYSIRQVTNATSYLWTAPQGATIVGTNTDTSVVVNFPTSFVSGTLSVVAVNGCFNNSVSTARNFSVSKKTVAMPGIITPSLANPCPIVGTVNTSTYTIRPVSYASGYTWTLSTGIILVANLGDTGVVVRFAAGFTTGTVSVSARNACSLSATRVLNVTAKVPGTPGVINGLTNVCSLIGQPTTGVYSITPVSGAGSYLWTNPVNSTIVSGQGTESIQLSFSAGFVSGSLTVRSISACGSSSARTLALVKNVSRPGLITASGPACPSTMVTYEVAPVPFASSYAWSVPTNATYVSGQGTTSFTVNYKPAFVSGTVTVKALNSCSSSAASSLAVNSSACAPVFSRKIQNETPDQTNGFAVYPNPTDGIVHLTYATAAITGESSVYITDMQGRQIIEKKMLLLSGQSGRLSFDLSSYSAGLYQLIIRQQGKKEFRRIIARR